MNTLRAAKVDDPWPVRTVTRPIDEGHDLWRAYMGRHRQNHPHQYHNGGIWPFIGGFWVLSLLSLGLRDEAAAALAAVARANAEAGWRFTEWFHGRTLAPMGMPGQTWNAATFLLALRALRTGTQPL
jgi:glycogen debranching enzyme